MLSVLMSLAMFAVVLLSLALGVGLGYLIIFGILDAFDRSRRLAKVARPQVLTTSAGND